MRKTTENIPRIILFMDTSRAYEQGLIRGILKYSRLHGPWKFFRIIPIVSGGRTIRLADLKNWRPTGIIWRERDGYSDLLELGLPAIIAPYRAPFAEHPNIITNDRATGTLAAEHFLDRGFRNFAYYGLRDWFWSVNRLKSFTARIASAGFTVSTYTEQLKHSPNEKQARLARWLKALPRPTGLMVCTDDCSHDCIEACKMAGLSIPEDIALIGVGNDELVCDFADPPLSSIVLNTEQAGYMAAELLAAMMSGRKTRPANIGVEPLHAVTRQSTDILATEDRNLARALGFIRDNAGHNISAEDVVRAIPVSRRTLYQKFHDGLGRSIHGEIRRVQMNYAAKMLLETDLQVGEIAAKLGYQDAKNLSRVFRHEKKTTPLAYRKANRHTQRLK